MQPDIIIFGIGNLKSRYRSGMEMQQTKEFYEFYTPIKVKGNYTATLWFYKYSPKIGIKITPSEIRVPAFLLNGNPDTITSLNAMGKLIVPISSTQSATIVIDSVTSRNWLVEIKTSRNKEVRSELEQRDSSLIVKLFSKSLDPIEIEEIVLTKNE